jgi:hypothetical protein
MGASLSYLEALPSFLVLCCLSLKEFLFGESRMKEILVREEEEKGAVQ